MHTFCVLDLETTYSKDYGRVSNQLLESNQIVRAGTLNHTTNDNVIKGIRETLIAQDANHTNVTRRWPGVFWPKLPHPEHLFNHKIIVAHNSKFELLWLFRYHWDATLKWLARGGILWCTQFTEYQLSGKTARMVKLNDLSPKYGGLTKYDKIKDYWAAGIKTEEIPQHELDYYLLGDIYNTYLIFKSQYEKINKLNLFKPLLSHFRDMVFTGLCEWFGMYCNPQQLDELRKARLDLKEKLEIDLMEEIKKFVKYPKALEIIGYTRNEHISALVYGGNLKYTKYEGTGHIYKTGERKGQEKFKVNEYQCPVEGLGIELEEAKKARKEGVGKTDSKTLSWYTEYPFINKLLGWRRNEQLLKTFLNPEGNGIRGLIHPDNCVHGYLNHCRTATGRLASNTPNMQNIDKESPLKMAFTSRFKDGLIVEADFAGLENSTMAQISGDINLTKDLWAGIDLHCKRAALLNGYTYQEFFYKVDVEKDKVFIKMRSKAKAPSFAYAYGAGKNKLKEATHLPDEDIDNFISINKKLYPQAVAFYEAFYTMCIKRSKKAAGLTREGNVKWGTSWKNLFGWPIVVYSVDSPVWLVRKNAVKQLGNHHEFTAAIVNFSERDRAKLLKLITPELREKLNLTSFTNTVFKNYPNQNLAAEIVVIFASFLLTRLYTYIILKTILPINTIHDSYVFDVADVKHRDILVKEIRYCEKQLPAYIKTHLDVDIKVPLKIDIKCGKNWKELETVRG